VRLNAALGQPTGQQMIAVQRQVRFAPGAASGIKPVSERRQSMALIFHRPGWNQHVTIRGNQSR
jgi:hypothetical protein